MTIQTYDSSETRLQMWMQCDTNVSKCWTCSLSRGVSERYFSRSSRSSRFSLSSRRLAFCSVAFVSCSFSTSSVTVLLPCGCRQKHTCVLQIKTTEVSHGKNLLRLLQWRWKQQVPPTSVPTYQTVWHHILLHSPLQEPQILVGTVITLFTPEVLGWETLFTEGFYCFP